MSNSRDNQYKTNGNSEPVSACEYLDDLLGSKPQGKSIKIYNPGFGFHMNENLKQGTTINTQPTVTDPANDDTNKLFRAWVSCQRGLVISPKSNDNHTFFVTAKKHKEQLEKLRKTADEAKKTPQKQSWFPWKK